MRINITLPKTDSFRSTLNHENITFSFLIPCPTGSFRQAYFFFPILLFLSSCSIQNRIKNFAKKDLISQPGFSNAHLGISIFDPSQNKYLYNYQSDKYFVPASNVKIFTCYLGMKYLTDSLPGIHYMEDDTAIYLIPTGDPTLLHKDFKQHPVIDFLKKTGKNIYIGANWNSSALGSGWSWGDYNEYYMAERSALPVYGNVIRWIQEKDTVSKSNSPFDQSVSIYSLPEVNWKVRFNPDPAKKNFHVQRDRSENIFVITEGIENRKEQDVPFVTFGLQSALELLKDTVGKDIIVSPNILPLGSGEQRFPGTPQTNLSQDHANKPAAESRRQPIYSQPTDSLLKRMMHRSDNFFAEQILLMVANEKLGVLDDHKIIDSILRTELSFLPQKPRWADGSGLSRYNLFTPECFITLLNAMQHEFGMPRLKVIFPTGGEGTLTNYYKTDSTYIFAKTGTLSGVVALSGYLYTKKNRLFIFSLQINNHRTSAETIRRSFETFLNKIRTKY